jgi:DMSO/TMAO reductase YedYZ molybdopterin-dependent catalytic subunit
MSEKLRDFSRRGFVRDLGAMAGIVAFGGFLWVVSDDLTREARAQTRADGQPRLPPGQHVIRRLRPMGGDVGDPDPGHFRLRVHGEVEHPFELSFADLLAMPQVEQEADVHCVTRWTVLGARWKGVRVSELAKRAVLKHSARHVIFEAAHEYTSNIPIHEALKPNVMVAHRLDGNALPRSHGAPVRAVVPDRYFWKSAKWLTGIRFVERDEPGYWEVRGYSNSADPWKEERNS